MSLSAEESGGTDVENTRAITTADLEARTRSSIPVVAILLGLLIGSALAFFFHGLFTAAPTTSADVPLVVAEMLETLDLPPGRGPVIASLGAPEVTADDRQKARFHLGSARSALAAQNSASARTELVQCIEQADLPRCHLELGLLLLLTKDPSGYAHLQRYLALDPAPEEASAIQKVLAMTAPGAAN